MKGETREDHIPGPRPGSAAAAVVRMYQAGETSASVIASKLGIERQYAAQILKSLQPAGFSEETTFRSMCARASAELRNRQVALLRREAGLCR